MAWISVWCSKLCYFDFHALLSSSIHIVWQWRMDIPYFWAFVLSSMSGCQKWMRKLLYCHEKWSTSATVRSVHNFSYKSTCLCRLNLLGCTNLFSNMPKVKKNRIFKSLDILGEIMKRRITLFLLLAPHLISWHTLSTYTQDGTVLVSTQSETYGEFFVTHLMHTYLF